MVRLLALTVVACSSSSNAPAKPAPTPAGTDTIAFVDVTVVPMDRDTALPHHTVIVRGQRIVAVGPVDSTPVPAGARTIDSRGKWLIPGLADMHVHTYDPQSLALFVSMGVTTIRVMWGDAAALGARDAITRGEKRMSPSIYTAGEIIDGKPPIWPGSLPVATPEEGAAAVRRQHRTGYDYIKVYSLLAPEVYQSIVATAAELKMPVIGHVPHGAGLGKALEAKQRSIEHLDGYARFAERDDSPIKGAKEFKVRAGAYKYADETKLADAIARTKPAGTWNCPTLVVLDRISKLDTPDAARPEYKYVPPAQIASWDPKKDFRFKSSAAEDFANMRGMVAWNTTLLKRLADAGAPILAGTDVGNPWLVPGFSLHDELALLVAAKLTPLQALRAATRAPAEFFDATNELGTIAVGRRADLVLLDGDPLAQIENTRKIAGVVLRGSWLPAAELAAERDRIAAIYSGKRTRFADVPPVAPKPLFTARYRASGDRVSGEERITALAGNGGVITIVGETRYDLDPDARWELDIAPDGMHRAIRIKQDGLELAVTRDGERVRIAGKLGGETITVDDALAKDEQLGGAPLAIDAGFMRDLNKLGPGASSTIKLAVLELRPVPAISHMVVVATREADGTRTIAGKQIPVRVFKIALGFTSSTAALDADGWPVETATHVRVDS